MRGGAIIATDSLQLDISKFSNSALITISRAVTSCPNIISFYIGYRTIYLSSGVFRSYCINQLVMSMFGDVKYHYLGVR